MSELRCPPTEFVNLRQLPADATILDYAARASEVSNRWRAVMDARADFRTTISAAGAMARAIDDLTTAIADSVACGDNRLS